MTSYVWLLSAGIIFSRFIHVVVCNTSLIFNGQKIPVYVYTMFYFYSISGIVQSTFLRKNHYKLLDVPLTLLRGRHNLWRVWNWNINEDTEKLSKQINEAIINSEKNIPDIKSDLNYATWLGCNWHLLNIIMCVEVMRVIKDENILCFYCGK